MTVDGLLLVRPVRLDDMPTDEITTQFLAWAREKLDLVS